MRLTFPVFWISIIIELRGGVKFPTGGIARERAAQNRLDSGADSTVWMEEVDSLFAMNSIGPAGILRGLFAS